MLTFSMLRPKVISVGLALLISACAAAPQPEVTTVPPHDNLNAALWMQNSVEYRASAAAAYALARQRLEQALADKTWTAAPEEQTGNFQNLPPAVVMDLDETALDNSAYQSWMVLNNQTFNPKTWTQFVNAEISTPVEGAVDFVIYAESRGVKVFYVTNRTAEEEPATRRLMKRFGFPVDGPVDTLLTARERPEWGSAKSTRRAYIAKDYRILLNIGDNFGDFSDAYRGSMADRQKVYEDNRQRWGREWIMLPNPSYGSFESAPFGHNYKLSADEQRAAKRSALKAWSGQ
ncbi:5'-nucleotidase, lipoprotein e(P4) family [uncultured Ferrovibrio sp.]|mgnify:CR=1 FL=1|jgi:5'-nucleotidase (lipoprotein e(P4) family)|uniref:5'-nucleotidase, lipoprotein e(P4) family n=1 Tax=uncultured Ferrovibrio sp. TaxID=1576913 RepID=UPI0026078322|nr:5'-nucleotidase, lipoprotein e(P4) family [uncultured Ferrovibrio sp.]